MSDSQGYDVVTYNTEGITVKKRFEEDQFPVPAIAFEFVSDRDDDVTVRMTDEVPEAIEVEDLGFHPEYGSEYWTIDEDVITFERDIEANSTYTTVYGIRATGTDDIEQFLSEPTLEEVDPPLSNETAEAATGEDDILPGDGTDVVRDVLSGESEPAETDETGEDETEGDLTLELNDPSETGAESADPDGSSSDATAPTPDADAGGTTGTVVEADSLVGALADELREQEVAAEDVALLREAFDLAADGTETARIEQLQSDIADLRAYTGALEEFLDENGTGEEVIEEFERRLDSFDDQLGDVESTIDDYGETVDAVEETVTSVEESVTTVSDEIDGVRADVDDVDGTVETVRENVESLQDGLEETDEEVESVRAEVDAVTGEVDMVGEELDSVYEEIESVDDGVDSIGQELDELGDALTDLEEDVAALEEEAPDEELTERLSEIESQLADLQSWQEKIKQTFGGT